MTNLTPNRAIIPTEIGGLYNLVHVEDAGIDGEEIVTPLEWLARPLPMTKDESAFELAEKALDRAGYEVTGPWEYTDEHAAAPIAKKAISSAPLCSTMPASIPPRPYVSIYRQDERTVAPIAKKETT